VDSISPRLLNVLADKLAKPLTMIFNASLQSSLVHESWRCANVTLIHKSRSKSQVSNYRPVSLTSVVCKVLESIIKDKIEEYLYKFDLIVGSQHGFVKSKSCLTNLLEFLEYCSCNLDQGRAVDVIYLDFQKAFDKVPHKRLLLKLDAIGICGKLYKWIESWLLQRQQRVLLNGVTSKWSLVKSGVPQGSVLGPLLFVIFVNDIDRNIVSRLLKFADDVKLFKSVDRIEDYDVIKDDLNTLCNWSDTWQMKFNAEKCKVMHIGAKNPNHNYQVNGQSLKDVVEERDLGITMHKTFKVSTQCAAAVKTANRILGMLKRGIKYKEKKTMLLLYKGLVRPHLEYCIQAWRPNLVKDIELLEGVQKRFSRMLPGLSLISYEARLKDLGLTTLELRRMRGDMIEVFKIIKGIDKINCFLLDNEKVYNIRGHKYK